MNTYLVDLRMSYDTTPEVIGARSSVEAADLFVRATQKGEIFIGDIRNLDRGLDVQTVPAAQHGVMKPESVFIPADQIPAMKGEDYVHEWSPRDPSTDSQAVIDMTRTIVDAYESAASVEGRNSFLQELCYEVEQFTGADVTMAAMTVADMRDVLADAGVETQLTDAEIHARLVKASFFPPSAALKEEIHVHCLAAVQAEPEDQPIVGM